MHRKKKKKFHINFKKKIVVFHINRNCDWAACEVVLPLPAVHSMQSS